MQMLNWAPKEAHFVEAKTNLSIFFLIAAQKGSEAVHSKIKFKDNKPKFNCFMIDFYFLFARIWQLGFAS